MKERCRDSVTYLNLLGDCRTFTLIVSSVPELNIVYELRRNELKVVRYVYFGVC